MNSKNNNDLGLFGSFIQNGMGIIGDYLGNKLSNKTSSYNSSSV